MEKEWPILIEIEGVADMRMYDIILKKRKQVNNIIGKNSGIKAVTNIIENIMQ